MALTARGERARRAIGEAATDLFTQRGYSATSVRDIAAAAGVDPAMVLRYYASKEQLFIETMSTARDAAIGWDGDLSTLGERIVRYVLDANPQTRSTFVALVHASEADRIGVTLRTMHESGFVGPLSRTLGGRDADLRARLIATLIGGLMYSLWVVGDEVLDAEEPEAIVAHYAPLVQHLVDE